MGPSSISSLTKAPTSQACVQEMTPPVGSNRRLLVFSAGFFATFGISATVLIAAHKGLFKLKSWQFKVVVSTAGLSGGLSLGTLGLSSEDVVFQKPHSGNLFPICRSKEPQLLDNRGGKSLLAVVKDKKENSEAATTNPFSQQGGSLEGFRKELDPHGYNELHYAISRGNKQLLENSLKKATKDELDAQDNQGYTPLHLACLKGFKEGIELLLQNGANREIENAEGSFPIDLLVNSDHLQKDEMIKLFETIPASVLE